MKQTITRQTGKRGRSYDYPLSTFGMLCGDSMIFNTRKHTVYTFKGNEQNAKDLSFIMRELGVNITRLEKTSFKFSHPNYRVRKMMFKLTRYARNTSTSSILRKTAEMINDGVQPHNAVLLAHYHQGSYKYYSETMDIIPRLHIVRTGFKTSVQWLNEGKKKGSVNNYYKLPEKKINVGKLRKLINGKKYKQAEELVTGR